MMIKLRISIKVYDDFITNTNCIKIEIFTYSKVNNIF